MGTRPRAHRFLRTAILLGILILGLFSGRSVYAGGSFMTFTEKESS